MPFSRLFPANEFVKAMERGKRSSAATDTRTGRRMRRASNLLTWIDIESDQSSTDRLDGALAVLPVPLLRDRVFGFLAPPPNFAFTRSNLTGFNLHLYQARLAIVRSVCQQWYRLAQFLVTESNKSIVRIPIEAKNLSGRKRVMELAAQTGDRAIELRFETEVRFEYGSRLRIPASEVWLSGVFGRFVNLILLDLSRVWNRVAVDVLELASRHCPQVIAVELSSTPFSPVAHEFVNASEGVLRAALKMWQDSNGGLRSLSVPNWAFRGNSPATFLTDVAAHCPRLEYLNVADPTFPSSTRRSLAAGTRPLDAPLPVWKSFYSSCSALRCLGIDWSMFSRDHLSMVTAAPMPQLETVEIVLHHMMRGNELPSFSPLLSLVSALPRLRSFSLDWKWYNAGVAVSGARCQDLVLHMATHCLHLERIDLNIDWGSNQNASAIAVDDSTISLLILRPSFQWIRVDSLVFVDGSLLDLFKKIVSATDRPFHLDVKTVSHIHAAVMELLEYLACSERGWKSAGLELCVKTRAYKNFPGNGDFVRSFDQVENLVNSVKRNLGAALSMIDVQMAKNYGNEIFCIGEMNLFVKVPPSRVRAYFSARS